MNGGPRHYKSWLSVSSIPCPHLVFSVYSNTRPQPLSSSMSDLASFTRDGASIHTVRCEMGRSCKSGSPEHPPGTKLRFMENSDPSKPGFNVCPTCRQYYLKKGTSSRKDSSSGEYSRCLILVNIHCTLSVSPAVVAEVSKNVNAAQKGSKLPFLMLSI
jgi:hypothetical protein